uniref:Uncharacterized protein n=1 Tax=Myotis myotis TaxID=51298 RepID=A0A7J7SPU6_MYOMY|nr:hypothetical protein mMyoMyo1_001768 [Myotis myotis]
MGPSARWGAVIVMKRASGRQLRHPPAPASAPARRHHTPRAAAPGPGSDQNRLDNQRPGQARPRLSDQFITSERRAPQIGSGTAAPPPPRASLHSARGGLRRRGAFHLGPARRAGVTTRSNKIKV